MHPKTLVKLACLIVALSALTARADNPNPPANAAAPATATSTATSPTPAAAVSAPAAAQAEPAFKAPAGYKTKMKNGIKKYCRTEVTLGSRFPTETCFTEDELKLYLAQTAEQRQEMTQRQGICPGGPCAGSK
jgi:hypothetical protein